MVVYPTTDKSNATNPKPPAPQSPTDNQEQPGDNAAPAKKQLSLAALADIVVSVIAVQQFPLGVRECLLAHEAVRLVLLQHQPEAAQQQRDVTFLTLPLASPV